MNSKMTEIELVNHYKGLDVRERIVALMKYDMENYSFPDMHIEIFMAAFEKSSLKPEVFTVLLDFCFDVEGQLVLSSISDMTNRWEGLKISTAYKALLQAKSDNEVIRTEISSRPYNNY